MYRKEVHANDVGTDLQFTVKDHHSGAIVDLSLISALTIVFRKPDGSAVESDAELLTDGTDGMVRFLSPDETYWDQVGQWDAQLKFTIPGWRGRSSMVSFRVHEALPLL